MRRDALREYVRGSLWVLPGLSVLAALAAGAALSRSGPGRGRRWRSREPPMTPGRC